MYISYYMNKYNPQKLHRSFEAVPSTLSLKWKIPAFHLFYLVSISIKTARIFNVRKSVLQLPSAYFVLKSISVLMTILVSPQGLI